MTSILDPTSPTKVIVDPPPVPSNNKRHKTIVWLTLAFLLAALAWILLWFFYLRFYESTDDAYVNGNMINVTSVISGTPIAFYADDTDLVEEGQVLVQLDDTDYKIRYEKQLANLASTVLQVKQMYEKVSEATANVQSMQATYQKARYDFENRKRLVDSKAISNEDFVHARDDFTNAEQNLLAAQSRLQQALAAVGTQPIAQHPQIEYQKAAVRDAYYKLQHCTIRAPATGYVAQRAVEVGQWVTPQSFMMAIIPTDYMWVDANYKETQLTDMRIGQEAWVTADIYGTSVVYKGKVIGIASGTGSVFSLIPPQNATGNWIKIVQRLPVRISLDPEMLKTHPLRLGLSALVDVGITPTDLPMLASQPSTKTVSSTKVFNLDLSEVDKKIDRIVDENLQTAQVTSHT